MEINLYFEYGKHRKQILALLFRGPCQSWYNKAATYGHNRRFMVLQEIGARLRKEGWIDAETQYL